MKKFALSLLTILFSVYGYASAATLMEKNISLNDANAITAAAVTACVADGYNVAVTVVDRAGNIKAVQRTDKAGPHTIEGSYKKAFTALSAKAPTSKIMTNAQNNPAAANMTDMPGFLLLAGGLPIKSGEEVIGAIGISGAPGGHLDEICATKAIEKVNIK